MNTWTTIAIGVALAAAIYKYVIYPYWLSPLSKIPNAHFTAPILSTWMDKQRQAGKEIRTIYAIHQKHGPVVRLGPNELSVNSLNGLKTIYTGAFEKDVFYQQVFINFLTDNMVGMLPNKAHADQKRMLSKIYSKSYLQESTDIRNTAAMLLLTRVFPILDNLAKTGSSVNVLPLFQAVGMDFTSAYLFGTKNSTTYLFNLHKWEKWLEEYEKFKSLSCQERNGGFIESWCLSLCRKVHENDNPNDVPVATNPVVYQQLHQSFEKKPDERPIELAVASEILDHLVAGHETTGISLTYLMWELSRHPELQAELRKELVTLSPTLAYPFVSMQEENTLPILPSPASIEALPLLDAIVRETLRLHSPIGAPLPRVTPSTSPPVSIEGYDNIPGGVKVSASAYTLHRIEEVYPHPTEWLPERWLNPGPDKIHDMRRLWWPFGSGGRMCLGSNFALQGRSSVFCLSLKKFQVFCP